MRLSFSILWFDDSEDYFDSLNLDSLREQISSWGFYPRIETVTTPEAFTARSPFEAYDLIVVDRNLEGYENGQEFIANIRGNAVYTEIIFYTAGNASNLWDAIREKQLEGVFVSSRNDIFPKIVKIGYQSIRKVLDLENMRGIVMAEVGELDILLDEVIKIGIKGLSSDQQNIIFNKFFEKTRDQYTKNSKALADFSQNPEIDGLLSLCDSNKRWENFNRLRKYHDKLKGTTVGDYVKEVLQPRNFLAHGRPEPYSDGGYLFRYEGREFIFSDATSLTLRQTILKYKKELSTIIALINE